MKRALITGITGQDGSFLAELLLCKGYEVHGVIRRSSSFNTARIDHIYRDPHEEGVRLKLHYGDLTDGQGLREILALCDPDEVYHLGAQSHVRVSFDQPIYSADVIALGTIRLLEAVRHHHRPIRFYQASSSEMFGASPPPQDEETPFHPRSPYASAKVHAFHQVVNYREAYGLFAVNGILFNHESPRRGETFVTRKVTRAATRISLGLADKLYLGNLGSRRDWGFAGDFVRAMWLMLQQDEAEDYVVATGESHSVGELCATAFSAVGLNWEDHVEHDPRYLRPTEVGHLQGNARKAREQLGWEPTVGFEELINRMIEADLKLAEREKILADAGHAARDGSGA